MQLLTHEEIMRLQHLIDKLKHPDIRIDAAQVKEIVVAMQEILKNDR